MVDILKVTNLKFSFDINKKKNKCLEKQIGWKEDSHHVVSKAGAQALRNKALISFGLINVDYHKKLQNNLMNNVVEEKYEEAASNVKEIIDFSDSNPEKTTTVFNWLIKRRVDTKDYDKIVIEILKFFQKTDVQKNEEIFLPLLESDNPNLIKPTIKILLDVYLNKYNEPGRVNDFDDNLDTLDAKLESKKLNNNEEMKLAVQKAQANIVFYRDIYRHIHSDEF